MILNRKERRSVLPLLLICLMMAVSCKSEPKTGNPLFGTFLNTALSESVPFISTDSLSSLAEGQFLLLDVREKPEFLVSHVSGAKHIECSEFIQESLPDMDENKTIILYCSVGCRSEKVGEKAYSIHKMARLNKIGGNDCNNILFGAIQAH